MSTAEYRLLAPSAGGDVEHTGGAQRRRAREGLRLLFGSVAAVALLVACAWTTLRASMHPGPANARLARDTQLLHDLASDGLAPYADADGAGQLAVVATGIDAPAGAESLDNGKKRKGNKRVPRAVGPCDRQHKHDNPGCAQGRLEIERVEPTSCATQGGCIITFHGRNIVAGADLFGHRADDLMTVSLFKDGADVAKCAAIHWIDNKLFECEVGPGVGSALGWNVSIPTHDAAAKRHGMGWTWASTDGFRFSGSPCDKNVCGFEFSYLSPTVNQIEPAVVDLAEETILLIHGANFGNSLANISIEFNGKSCVEMELVNDNALRCLIEPVMEIGIVPCSVTVGGQTTQVQIPVKDVPDSDAWPFTSDNTFGTEQWNITLAAIMEQTGLSQSWFETHEAAILSSNPGDLQSLQPHDEWETVAMKLFRDYLKAHFDSDMAHAVEDDDGVYIRALGNKLNGNKEHDSMVLTKQLQVMEAATGEPRFELAPIVGDAVEKEPPCAGYPDCAPAAAVGHRGWTWHWAFDESRNSWSWEYAPISDGQDPPVSCGYCDPVKVRIVHSEAEAKQREEICMHCVVDKFKNMDSCSCADFKAMCLQTSSSILDGVSKPENESPAWIKCADGHGVCQCNGKVRFGIGSTWSEEIEVAHEVECSREIFGDPLYGAHKHCECYASAKSNIGAFQRLYSIQELSGEVKRKRLNADPPGREPVAASSPLVNPPFRETECSVKAAASNCSQIGGIPSEDGLSCCLATCGSCGGKECAARPGGRDACCMDGLKASGVVCGTPPCLMQDDSGLSENRQKACATYGGVLDPNSLQCCAASCGTCGGESCENAPGGADSCCLDNIASQDRMCSGASMAPCTMSAGGGPDARSAEVPGNVGGVALTVVKECQALGGVADAFGVFCCPSSCGTCGGLECARRLGGEDACCGDKIADANVFFLLLLVHFVRWTRICLGQSPLHWKALKARTFTGPVWKSALRHETCQHGISNSGRPSMP